MSCIVCEPLSVASSKESVNHIHTFHKSQHAMMWLRKSQQKQSKSIFCQILYYCPQLYIHSWSNWAYTCPHFRFRRQQTQVVAERGRFPHLASCRQLSAAPLPAQRNIDSILSKTYLSSQLGNVKLPLQRSTPNIHLSCQQDGIIENIPQWEQGLQFTNHHALHCNHYSENRVL